MRNDKVHGRLVRKPDLGRSARRPEPIQACGQQPWAGRACARRPRLAEGARGPGLRSRSPASPLVPAPAPACPHSVRAEAEPRPTMAGGGAPSSCCDPGSLGAGAWLRAPPGRRGRAGLLSEHLDVRPYAAPARKDGAGPARGLLTVPHSERDQLDAQSRLRGELRCSTKWPASGPTGARRSPARPAARGAHAHTPPLPAPAASVAAAKPREVSQGRGPARPTDRNGAQRGPGLV